MSKKKAAEPQPQPLPQPPVTPPVVPPVVPPRPPPPPTPDRPAEPATATAETQVGGTGMKKRYTSGSRRGGGAASSIALQASVARKALLGQ